MSSANRQAIYNRLASAPTFHPSSANLFTDWNLQAGDVVTVQSEDESYASPIYSMRMKWSGAPKVELESTGNNEREPLPAMARKQYGMGAGMGGMQKEQERIDGILYDAGLYYNQYGVFMYATAEGNGTSLGASFKVMADAITSEVSRATEAEGEMFSRITQTATDIQTLVSRTGINSLGESETLYSRITQNAESIQTLVTKTGINSLGNNQTLYSRITQNAESIQTLVTKTGINDLGNNQTLYSRITQTAESIESLVMRTGVNNLGNNETMYSKITQTAESIQTLVSRTGINSLGNNQTLYSRINQEADRIGLVVEGYDNNKKINAASIVMGINAQDPNAQSYVNIQANRINLSGYVTADTFSALNASFSHLVSGESTAGTLSATLLRGGTIYFGNSRLQKTSIVINGASVNVITY